MVSLVARECLLLSFRRKPESRNSCELWTPAFAGVTTKRPLAKCRSFFDDRTGRLSGQRLGCLLFAISYLPALSMTLSKVEGSYVEGLYSSSTITPLLHHSITPKPSPLRRGEMVSPYSVSHRSGLMPPGGPGMFVEPSSPIPTTAPPALIRPAA
jgi:hypothetical protein